MATVARNVRFYLCALRQVRTYAIKKAAGTVPLAPVATGIKTNKIKLPVEKDPEKLINYVCGSNIYKEGEDIKLKDDSEYPEWLWKLDPSKAPGIEDLDPDTLEYWETLHHTCLVRQNRILKVQKLPRMRVNDKDKITKLRELRFRALAGYHYDPGEKIN